jgi:hypothetical protein
VKTRRDTYLGLYLQCIYLCHQNPNPARKTVPLNTSHSYIVQVYISGKEDVQTEGDLKEKCSLYFQTLTVEMGLYFQTLTVEMDCVVYLEVSAHINWAR